MSTFDGIVDEFPNIRIDYFRRHLDKTPPQACFLSHVHSDHLQGLETLKMPFVYCSMATKKILLRMEKYPHRINFAKGILEARKQTYKSLGLVLRALPLETPVDLELDPKTKIRVTLFEANHCPGAVMFLIEDSGKAILYTGDIRAESWWVNSIVRNPILLPYACGAKRLDGMYLDTTFASRSDIYENFPTKAEGLKELLTKVSKCPNASTLYFRSWTLGYEDVWITLSNFLHSPIHVDEYQLRIFRSIADDAGNINRGPALAGFNHGNQYQPGCLTDDPNVTIHSCEPGTECYDRIKKREDVIWIIPIVSRLRDGTEIPEVGAGGGGGDLYQTPQLECIDEGVLEALEELCAANMKYEAVLSHLREAFFTARANGEPSISLEGLRLDLDEEVSLKQFIHLFSVKNERTDADTNNVEHGIIRFPYSRHSSFSELRHLISSFKPKDICPCTVDIDTWSEEVSIQSLFGDLCSDDTFKHDQKTRAIVEERQKARNLKRKRSNLDDSQQTHSQRSIDTEEVYRSAKTSLRKDNTEDEYEAIPQVESASKPESKAKFMSKRTHPTTSEVVIPPSVQKLHDALNREFGGPPKPQPSLNTDISKHPPTTVAIPELDAGQDNTNTNADDDDSITSSLPTSTFDSYSHVDFHSHLQEQDLDEDSKTRLSTRRNAYLAARAVLDKNQHGEWDGLRLRSLGWKGHTEEEVVL